MTVTKQSTANQRQSRGGSSQNASVMLVTVKLVKSAVAILYKGGKATFKMKTNVYVTQTDKLLFWPVRNTQWTFFIYQLP